MAIIRLDDRGDRLMVWVGGVLDIYAAKDAWAALGRAVSTTRPTMELDLSKVEELDLAGTQVLLWLKATAQTAGVRVELKQTSAAVEGAARSLHLTDWGRP